MSYEPKEVKEIEGIDKKMAAIDERLEVLYKRRRELEGKK